MNRILNFAALLLPPADRDPVLGDLAEAGAPLLSAISAILGLALRQQLDLWRSWRPWLAGFGLWLTVGLALLAESVSTFLCFTGCASAASPGSLVAHQLLFAVPLALPLFCFWAVGWSAGFVMASISRRTLWATSLLMFIPALHCFSRFGIPGVTPYCIFLFVLPVATGLRRSLRGKPLSRWVAALFAFPNLITLLSLNQFAPQSLLVRVFSSVALWPTWYMLWLAFGSKKSVAEPVR